MSDVACGFLFSMSFDFDYCSPCPDPNGRTEPDALS